MNFIHRFDPATGIDPRVALVLHGTGGDENSLVPFAQTLLPGAAMLAPRGRVLENGMPRFFRRFAEGVFDYDSIREESSALAAFVEGARAAYGLAGKPVVAIGYSNGANAAWSTLLLRPDMMDELVLFRPMQTLTDVSPNLEGKRIFVSAGKHDPIVGVPATQKLVDQMVELGAKVVVNWHEGGHELSRQEIDAAAAWLGLA